MTRRYRSSVAPCARCGWGNRRELERQGRFGFGSLCVSRLECERRERLNAEGRPRESGCRCERWPCPCACHPGRVTRTVHRVED